VWLPDKVHCGLPVGPYNHIDLDPAINLKLRKQVELLAAWVRYWRARLQPLIHRNNNML
jgi:hypothetical protein